MSCLLHVCEKSCYYFRRFGRTTDVAQSRREAQIRSRRSDVLMGDVIGSSLRASSRRQRRGLRRWLPRGGGALLASVAFHAAAAVTVGGVLARGTRGGQRPAQLVELDLAPAAELATSLPVPAAAPRQSAQPE